MDRRRLPIPIGLVMMALAIICSFGWYFWNWTFVDPYFSTLVLLASPFFIGMGLVSPVAENVTTSDRISSPR
jgi:hypothetical protein